MSSSTGSDQVQNNVISSTKSNTVKKIQGFLTKQKKQVELGQTIVKGLRLVFDLLDNLQTRSLVQQVLVSVDEYEGDYQSRLAAAPSSSSETFVQLVTPPVLKACRDTVTPQGIVALTHRSLQDDRHSRSLLRRLFLCLL
jgi:hypothetical protein